MDLGDKVLGETKLSNKIIEKARNVDDCLRKIRLELRLHYPFLPYVEPSKAKSEEVGNSFEPRTLTVYQIKIHGKDEPIGTYSHTAVFEKNGDLAAEFGEYEVRA